MATKNTDKPKSGTVKARVLIDGHFGKVNDVIEVSTDDAASPDLDSHPDAVAYAEGLK